MITPSSFHLVILPNLLLQLRKHHNPLRVYEIGVARDERERRADGGIHYLDFGRLDDARAGDEVGELLDLRVNGDLVAGLQAVEVAEDFAEDVVVSRDDHVAGLAGVGGADVLSDALLELLPRVAQYHRCIYADGGDDHAHGLP